MLMWRSLLLLVLCVTPALAEVCDKVARADWSPEQGPINVIRAHTVLIWIAVFAAAVASIRLLRSRVLAWIAAFLALLPVCLVGLLWVFSSGDIEMTNAAIREGCWSEGSDWKPVLMVFVFAAAAAFFVWAARGRTVIR
jgi:hypothetical protein